MAHVVSSPHSFLTAKQIRLENANARMVQGTFFGVNGYSHPIEKHDEDMPLDFSKKKDSLVKRPKEESHERQNAISEHSAYSANMRRSPSTVQHVKTNPKAVIESRNTSSPNRPCIPQIDSEFSENPVAYPNLSSAALMEHLAYVNAVNKYSAILPKLNNVHMPQIEQQEQINNRRELSPICKMMENQSFDSGIISPVTATSATPHEFSQLSRNNSSSLDLLQNNLKFNNTTAFAPILITPPPSNVAGSRAVQEPMTRTPHFPVLDEVSILQRTLTASSTQHQLDEYGNPHRGLKNKQARPFKSYNPLPKPFPTGLPTLPLGIMQDFEDQEYRYQQFMETFYTPKNPKVGTNARNREPADNHNRSSGDDRRESSPQSDSSDPRPQTSSQSKSSEDTNGSSADAQASLRQAADTSTAPHNTRSAKRVKSLPDDQKDEAYWERRRKNNEAAKRSRDTRRKKEDYIAMRAKFLEDENKSLRLSVAWLKQQLDTIKCCAAHNHNRF